MLNYSVPPLQFLVGSFDASEYLDSISLSVPMFELGQALLWSGRFKVSFNLAARMAGLSEVDFSELGNPGRWRPYQQAVRLYVRGFGSPVLRIENYRYDAQSFSGEGILTQIPMAVAGDRPGVEIPCSAGTPPSTVVSGSIGGAIGGLLSAAFADCRVRPGFGVAGDGGVLDVPLVTRNPWGDAVRLSGLGWNWLTVDGSESIVSVDGDGGGIVFSRAVDKVELVPDLAAIFQAAGEAIVTGARQVPDKSATLTDRPATVPRPKFKTTEEFRPAGTVFSGLGSSTSPVLFEQKTIIYQYWDDDRWSEFLPLFGNQLTEFLFDIQSQTQTGINKYRRPPDLNVPLQTITIKRQPFGFLFPNLGTNVNLTEAEVLIESGLRKLTLKPLGVLFPDLGSNASLTIEKREDLTSAAIPPGATITPVNVDKDGTVQKYEARPVLEALQPIPTRPLKTEVLKGVCRLAPLGWSPVVERKLVVDFGFLPDEGRAGFLARRIAVREERRRGQVLVDMPIPSEWLGAGWTVLGKCQIGGDVLLMDGCMLSIADGEAKFGFSGGLVSSVPFGSAPGTVPVTPFRLLVDAIGDVVLECEVVSGDGRLVELSVVLELVVSTVADSIAGGDVVLECELGSIEGRLVEPSVVLELVISTDVVSFGGVDAIGDVVLECEVVSAPVTLVVPSVVLELAIDVGVEQVVSIVVSPASSFEGIPTVDIAVSPSSGFENSAIGVFTISRSSASVADLSSPLTVSLSVGGTASFGVDYTAAGAASFTGSAANVVIPVGMLAVDVTLTAIEDVLFEPDETVVLTVLPSVVGYQLGGNVSAVWTIANDDSAVKTVLLHFNGANGSTAIVDSSPNPVAVTAIGNAAISTVQSKFGGSSLRVNGFGSYAEIADIAALELGGADFTIDFWIYRQGTGYYLSKGNPFGNDIAFHSTYTPNENLFIPNVGNNVTRTTSPPTLNTWAHIALTRKNGIVRQFLNGNGTGTAYAVSDLRDGGAFRIGGTIVAYIDEVRIIVGMSDPAFDTNFAVPTSPYT